MTLAPCSSFTPWMMAVGPSLRMRPPMRFSSPTWRKRSGKMRSVMTLMPSPRQSRAMSWACRSVGKPGYGWVVISTAVQAAGGVTKIVPFCRSIFTPTSSSRSCTAIR